jgi:RNA polymerase sigma-70 factor (ECF subfamily)
VELRESGRGVLFEELLPSLQGDEDGHGYAEIARRLGTSEGTIRVTVHRLRRRYRELVRALVSQTLNNPMDVEAELAHLMAALRR